MSDRATHDVHVLRDRVSDGMRVASYAVRYPHRLISYVQLLKQASEQHVKLDADCDHFRTALRGSDNEIDNFFDRECQELLRAIDGKKASEDGFPASGPPVRPYDEEFDSL